MTVAAKCNIIPSAKQIVDKLKGYVPKGPNKDIIFENYVEWLACPTQDQVICHPDGCVNEPIVHICNVSGTIAYEENLDTGIVSFRVVDPIGDLPLTYAWSFRTSDFIASSPTNKNGLVLKVVSTKRLDVLVSRVSVVVEDAGGCKTELVCIVTIGGCVDVECPNISSLQLINKVAGCPKVRALVITRI